MSLKNLPFDSQLFKSCILLRKSILLLKSWISFLKKFHTIFTLLKKIMRSYAN